ncbi:hypothetical protein C8R43DRAFT_1105253 [Mycena crocata]|nr:hypothetical protein C8R43DRAFT_1105253 [Mycena crocata]
MRLFFHFDPPPVRLPICLNMSLWKIGDDHWTPGCIKSTFQIILPDSPLSKERDARPITTCGFGWRFLCTANRDKKSNTPIFVSADGDIQSAWRISLFFDPYLVRSVAYGKLSFTVHVSKDLLVSNDANDMKSVTLPLENLYRYTQPQVLSFQTHLDSEEETKIGTYIYTGNPLGTPTVEIIVNLPPASPLSIPRSVDARLERLLVRTMNGEEAVDLKFYTFSRKHFGHVTGPKPIFADTSLIEGYSESLDLLISGGGFAESLLVDLNRHKMDDDVFEEYDYLSDSDLDSDDGEREDTDTASSRHRSPDPETPRVLSPVLDAVAAGIPLPPSRPESPGRRMGRVVVVRGTAFKTWTALLHYMYTSKISFSTISPQTIEGELRSPRCSAKSMYRLADKFGLDELKAVSLSAINQRLSRTNIMHEVFSRFTSIYPEVQDIEVEFLRNNFSDLKAEIDNTLDGLCRGNRPHCVDVLRKIVAGRNPSASVFLTIYIRPSLMRAVSPIPRRWIC